MITTFRVVRLTSPNLNYLIITGVVLTYLATFAYCLPSTNPSVVLTACCVSSHTCVCLQTSDSKSLNKN